MHRHIVPDVVKDQSLQFLSPEDTIYKAAKIFADKNIGSILIVESEKLVGIFTERDLASRVIAKDLDPKKNNLRDVMTPNPCVLAPKDTAQYALSLMKEMNCRHLPVLDGEKVIGMVSIRDLYSVILAELKEDVQERDAFIFGQGYGGPS